MDEFSNMFTGFFEDNGAFDKLAGAAIGWERAQAGADASGASQETITKIPTKETQVVSNTPQVVTQEQGMSTNTKLMLGAGVAVALFILTRKR